MENLQEIKYNYPKYLEKFKIENPTGTPMKEDEFTVNLARDTKRARRQEAKEAKERDKKTKTLAKKQLYKTLSTRNTPLV